MNPIRRRRTVLAIAITVAAVGTGTAAVSHAAHQQRHSPQTGGMMPQMGPVHYGLHRTWKGYYDGHLDTYFNTDVSNKMQAKMMGVNFAPTLQHLRMSTFPEIYLVEGRGAPGQDAVFGSEPGEKDYSPLWHETILTWKANAKPVTITSDNQVNQLEKQGVLSERDGHTLLNCPIIRVGKGGS